MMVCLMTIQRVTIQEVLAAMSSVELPEVLTEGQCRAARALIDWSRDQLSQACGVDVSVIRDFEHGAAEPDPDIKRKIRYSLEESGAVFIPEEAGRGVGVRLKFSRPGVRAIRRWEGEGGTVGEDDV